MTTDGVPCMMLLVGLLDRILTVLEDNAWSEAEWSRRAGLSEKTHLSTFIGRLRKNPEATIDLRTAARLADAAGVSLDWLALGRGTKGGAYVVAHADPRYPARGVAVAAAWTFGYEGEAIRRVLAIDHLLDDPGLEYWMAVLRAENEAATRKLLPPPPPEGPDPGPRPGPEQGVATPERR